MNARLAILVVAGALAACGPKDDPAYRSIDGSTDARSLTTTLFEQVKVSCPYVAGTLPTIWGTNIYTDDSPICVAAMHKGLLNNAAGADLTIELWPGQPSYAGTAGYNGVTSDPFGTWDNAFVFIPLDFSLTCGNGILDGPESDVDCGRYCGLCANGKLCIGNADCASGKCSAGGTCTP